MGETVLLLRLLSEKKGTLEYFKIKNDDDSSNIIVTKGKFSWGISIKNLNNTNINTNNIL